MLKVTTFICSNENVQKKIQKICLNPNLVGLVRLSSQHDDGEHRGQLEGQIEYNMYFSVKHFYDNIVFALHCI